MIRFPLNEKRFSFFLLQTIYELASCIQIPRTIEAFSHVWKWHNVQRARSKMRRYTTHTLYRSKLWQQDHCQHPQNANPDGSTLKGTAQRIVRPFGGDGAEAQGWGHLQEDPDQEVHRKGPGIDETPQWCGDLLMQSGGRWQTLGVAAGLGAGPQVQRDPGLASEGVLRICTFLSLAPLPPPTWTRWTTSFDHTSRTWPPTTPKPAWSPPPTEYSLSSRWRLRKRHAPSSRPVSRRWLRLKAATLNRYQLYYIIKLPELIFSIKV